MPDLTGAIVSLSVQTVLEIADASRQQAGGKAMSQEERNTLTRRVLDSAQDVRVSPALLQESLGEGTQQTNILNPAVAQLIPKEGGEITGQPSEQKLASTDESGQPLDPEQAQQQQQAAQQQESQQQQEEEGGEEGSKKRRR